MSWLPSVVTAAPGVEPISTAEAKAQLGIDGADFDALLAIYIKAARQHVESYTGLALITQTRLLRASAFADLARLPAAPIASVASVEYLDTDGAEQTLPADVYEAVLVGLEPEVRLKVGQSWPVGRAVRDAIRVSAVCGFGATGAAVPEPIRLAMLLLAGDFLANREDTNVGNIVTPMPNGVRTLLTDYRLNP